MPNDLNILNNKAAVVNLKVPLGEEWRRTIRFMSRRTGVVQNLSSVAFTGEIKTAETGGTLVGEFTFEIANDSLSVVVYISGTDISSLGFNLLYFDMFYVSVSAAPVKWMKGTFQVDSSVTLF